MGSKITATTLAVMVAVISAMLLFMVALGGLVLLLSIAALAVTLVALPVLWGYLPYKIALALSLVTLLFAERQPIFRWVAEAFNLFAIVSIALLLCYGFYVLFTRDQQSTPLAIRGAIGVIFFIVIASSLPALLYYLFERQKSETLHVQHAAQRSSAFGGEARNEVGAAPGNCGENAIQNSHAVIVPSSARSSRIRKLPKESNSV